MESIYSVDLLFEQRPEIPTQALWEAMKRQCPGAEPMSEVGDNEVTAFVHRDRWTECKDGRLPAQFVVMQGSKEGAKLSFPEAVRQSWSEHCAVDLVEKSTYALLLTDMFANGLPYKERLAIFLDGLEAVLSVTSPLAIHWRTSQQIRKASDFLQARRQPEDDIVFHGPLNVRFFRINDGARPGEMLCDTMGLAILGLPDVQCHFHTLDVNDVVKQLYNIAFYIFQNGDVIEDGHTVEGIRRGSKWKCQHEESLVEPTRIVLDLHAGRFAAGKRK